MGHPNIWKRLLWKEIREAFFILLVGIALPPISFSSKLRMLQIIGIVSVPLLVALWGVTKGSTKRRNAEYLQTHLPLRQTSGWLATFLLPLVLAALLGAWYGCRMSAMIGWTHEWDMALMGSLCLAGAFASCYLLSATLSAAPAALVGVIWLIPCSNLTILTANIDKAPDGYRWFLGILASSIVGAAGGSLFQAVAKQSSRTNRQVVPLLIMLSIVAYPGTRLIHQARINTMPYTPMVIGPKVSPDGSLILTPGDTTKGEIVFTNYRTARQKARLFGIAALPVGIKGPELAYVVQQSKGRKTLSIFAWDLKADRVRQAAAFPAGEKALMNTQFRTELSPDGRYAVLSVGNRIGSGCDIWMVELGTGKSRLLLPNSNINIHRASWLNDQMLLSGFNGAITVDLGTLKAEALRLPLPKED